MVGWGLIGTGLICQEFVQAFKASLCKDAAVVALCSRRPRGSSEVAAVLQHVEDASSVALHPTPEAMVADERVQVAYLGVPTSTHYELARRCLEHAHGGLRAVVIEKPMTLTAVESQELMNLAERRGILLVEAVWSRFFPLYRRLAELLRGGELGAPLSVRASFGWCGPADDSKLHDIALGNGAMRVVGCYAINLAILVFGVAPIAVGHVVGRRGSGGADTFASAVLDFGPDGDGRPRTARIAAAVDEDLPVDAEVVFTGGKLTIDAPFLAPLRMRIAREAGAGDEEWLDTLPVVPNGRFNLPHSEGLAHEIAAVSHAVQGMGAAADCATPARRECAEQPWEHTLAVLRVIELVLAQVHSAAEP